MRGNERDYRVARIVAEDLANGDVIVDTKGDYIGTVDAEPVLRDGIVIFQIFTGNKGSKIRRWGYEQPVRIEIPRRTS